MADRFGSDLYMDPAVGQNTPRPNADQINVNVEQESRQIKNTRDIIIFLKTNESCPMGRWLMKPTAWFRPFSLVL